ncbi:S-layer homology domain-containing protein [Ureibacillus thermosphaericus]|uniref:S-layer homology domain-containing protein n=1 Tax=Ureibacillus thermosphaericus TaxID=51173 RepID=UPI00030C00AB|nr:S-layer homology domain-containing protein [Ureibacillus thermosphaericus]
MNYKKFFASAATATLVASAIVPAVSAATFTDVEDNTHKEAIDALAEMGIVKGYKDGTYKPNNTLTRGNVVKMLGRWLEEQGKEIPEDWDTVQRFKDLPVDFADEELVKYAALVKDHGVFLGSDNKLMHMKNMDRSQMALTLNRVYEALFGVSLIELAEEIDDVIVVDMDEVYNDNNRKEAVQALRDLGISIVEKFRPNETVTRGQFASFLYRTIQVSEQDELKVVSVNATTASTIEVIFNEPINNTQENLQQVKVIAKEDATTPDSLTFTLSEDGKTLTITNQTLFNGEYEVVIEPKKVKGTRENQFVSEFKKTVKFEEITNEALTVISAKFNKTTKELEITYSEEIKLLNDETVIFDFEVLVNDDSLTTPIKIDANKGDEESEKATKVIVKLEDLVIEADDTISLQLLEESDIKDLTDKKIEVTEVIPVEMVEE